MSIVIVNRGEYKQVIAHLKAQIIIEEYKAEISRSCNQMEKAKRSEILAVRLINEIQVLRQKFEL